MSKLANFMELLYRSVVPTRPEKPEEFKEKSTYVPQTAEHAPGLPKDLTHGLNQVTNVFNAYCTEMGVQCTIGMNPSDYKRQMAFKVVGDRDVKIVHRGKTTFLAPGESLVVSISDTDVMTGRVSEWLPEITLMPHGNIHPEQNAGIDGWSNYKTHQSSSLPTTSGINRGYFSYANPGGIIDIYGHE